LTGAPGSDFLTSTYTADQIWQLISDAFKRNFILGCGTSGKGNDKILSQNGLAESHAFAILGVYTI
jgi:hypothetical protein